jgi:Brp/Blh family beta-carotene 15,15'-monooxygenase
MLASRLNIYFGIITLFVIVPYLMGWSLPLGFDTWVLIFSLAITGIPHGAIDHVIFLQNPKDVVKNNNLFKTFFTPYLLMVGLTFALWIFIPAVMFWFFLVVAAYHFGQSQLYYISLPFKSVFKLLIYIVWGTFILSSLWLFHWQEQSIIIQSVFDWNLDVGQTIYQSILYATIISGLGSILLLVLLYFKGNLSLKMLVQEVLVLVLLSLLFYFTTPYVAFAVYFGLWHATRVIITEFSFLKMKKSGNFSVVAFLKSFLPFSLLSFLGLGLLFWVSQILQASISPFMLFLIFISALTMPHAYFMERMYNFLANSVNPSSSSPSVQAS